ncbi:hypothetical protein WME97_33665 [Sorangium sp. So ce367]|uniref:hypothetical protein n=1 Tax=Sorangium sp. So ce367 TaxID=3133305 RepID=UPI003F5FB056
MKLVAMLTEPSNIARFLTAYLRGPLRAHGDNLPAAARVVRRDRTHLHELLRRHGLAAREA